MAKTNVKAWAGSLEEGAKVRSDAELLAAALPYGLFVLACEWEGVQSSQTSPTHEFSKENPFAHLLARHEPGALL